MKPLNLRFCIFFSVAASLSVPRKRVRRCSIAHNVRRGLLERGLPQEKVTQRLLDLGLIQNELQAKSAQWELEAPCSDPNNRRGVDFMSLISINSERSAPSSHGPMRAVWVRGYPRSGTSTTLSMVSSSAAGFADYTSKQMYASMLEEATGRPGQHHAYGNQKDQPHHAHNLRETQTEKLASAARTFALFEPCHDGDSYDNWLEDAGCGALLAGLSRCNFTHVKNLWGWDNPHSTNFGDRHFSQEKATNLCTKSELVAFKTVADRHSLKEWQWLLNFQPHMRILDVVRDPRGIWASWSTTPAFTEDLASGALGTLTDICKVFADNIDFDDSRVHRVVFERLVANPMQVTEEVFNFLGVPFGNDQRAWVKRTFDAKECPPHMSWFDGYTDCHENSHLVSEKWREVLSAQDRKAFRTNKACIKVAKAYDYPSV